MKRIILLVLLLVSIANFAKDVPPALFILDDPDDRTSEKVPLSITALNAEVVIHGNLAQTEVTLTFHNHTDLNTEGEFYYPLPDNSAMTGYALDIRNQMVEGVAIEKEKATLVFETIKRKNLDPGLVEWENKNCFKTRVFPIFPKKSRTIRIQYLTEITDGTYNLPLKFKQNIKNFKFKATVKNAISAADITCDNRQLSFTRDDVDYIAQFSETDIIPHFNIEIKISKKIKSNTLLIERDTEDNIYFKITETPQIPSLSAIKPEKINILWDASGSRDFSKHKREFKVLSDFFARFAKSPITVNVQAFNFIDEKNASFSIKNGNCQELLKFLAALRYDGGTQFGDIEVKPADLTLLFSDGFATFGETTFPEINSPVFAFSSNKQANSPYLKKLAAKTGGAYFNLLKDSNIADKIGVPSFNFISAEYDYSDFEDITPSTPENFSNIFIMTGRLLTGSGKIKINYGTGEKILYSTEHKINSSQALDGALLRKYQAMKKLDELMVMPKINKWAILALGKKHGLVTPYTSLIVLEEMEDYIRYKIPPPKSQPKMLQEYYSRVPGNPNPKNQIQDRINTVITAWNNRVMWWNTDFKYKPGFKYKPFSYEARGDYLYDDDFGEDEDFGGDDMFDTEATFGDADDGGGRISSGKDTPSANSDYTDEEEGTESDVAIKPWDPATPYLTALRKSSLEKYRGVYWKMRPRFRNQPAFFLDCADFFYTKGDREFAIRILSNIGEFNIDNAAMQRIMAYKYAEMKRLDLAIKILNSAIKTFPENPNIYRELALLIAKRAETQNKEQDKIADYNQAINLLYTIVTSEWRDIGMALLAVMDINRIIPKAKAAGLEEISIPLPLIRQIDADLRIVISNFSGMEEMHFWIEEPSEERISCVHPLSLTGGIISGAAGPEEYFTRKAMKGTYSIKTRYSGAIIEKLFGAIILKLDIYTNYGRAKEKHNSATIHLKRNSREVEIGKVRIKQ